MLMCSLLFTLLVYIPNAVVKVTNLTKALKAYRKLSADDYDITAWRERRTWRSHKTPETPVFFFVSAIERQLEL